MIYVEWIRAPVLYGKEVRYVYLMPYKIRDRNQTHGTRVSYRVTAGVPDGKLMV